MIGIPSKVSVLERRAFLAATAAGAGIIATHAFAQGTPELPGFIRRGMAGPGQKALQPLIGKWRGTITLYMAVATLEKPLTVSGFATERTWINDGRILQETIHGEVNGAPYWRLGFLIYDNMKAAYEWVTFDNMNAGMMLYRGKPGSGPGLPTTMTGSFVEQGVLGESYAGKTVECRTDIIVKGADENVFDIYFTAPGEKERIADHNVYTRVG
jgi:hypothetical protein